MSKGVYRKPTWDKDKGMKFIRVGGLSHVIQDNGKAPERKGLWAFIWPYFDWFFVSGHFSHKNGRKKDPNQWRKREFWYRGPIYTPINLNKVGFGASLVESALGFPWWLTDTTTLYESMCKVYAYDLKQLKNLECGGAKMVDKGFCGNPYSSYISTDHYEVFIPRRKIKC